MRTDHWGCTWSLAMSTEFSPLPFLPVFCNLSCLCPLLQSPNHRKYFKKCLNKKKMKVTNEDVCRSPDLRLLPRSSSPVRKWEQHFWVISIWTASAHQTSISQFPSTQCTKVKVPAQMSRSSPRKQPYLTNAVRAPTAPARNASTWKQHKPVPGTESFPEENNSSKKRCLWYSRQWSDHRLWNEAALPITRSNSFSRQRSC